MRKLFIALFSISALAATAQNPVTFITTRQLGAAPGAGHVIVSDAAGRGTWVNIGMDSVYVRISQPSLNRLLFHRRGGVLPADTLDFAGVGVNSSFDSLRFRNDSIFWYSGGVAHYGGRVTPKPVPTLDEVANAGNSTTNDLYVGGLESQGTVTAVGEFGLRLPGATKSYSINPLDFAGTNTKNIWINSDNAGGEDTLASRWWVRNNGVSKRFGVAGEDATGSQARVFNGSGNAFTLNNLGNYTVSRAAAGANGAGTLSMTSGTIQINQPNSTGTVNTLLNMTSNGAYFGTFGSGAPQAMFQAAGGVAKVIGTTGIEFMGLPHNQGSVTHLKPLMYDTVTYRLYYDEKGTTGGSGSYTLPTASASVLGGVKVGSGLYINGSGVLSATAPALESGVYTPTVSGGTMTVEPIECHYTRIGDVVSVTGSVGVTAAAAYTTAIINISVPVSTADFNNYVQATGTATAIDGSLSLVGRIFSNQGDQTVALEFRVGSNNKTFYHFHFTYTISYP